VKIALAFDSKLARKGIAELLRNYDFTVTEELSCDEIADASALDLKADVIVLNVDDFSRTNPAEFILRLRADLPKLKIVLIGGASSDHERLQSCIDSGAHGFITDEAPPEALAQYVQLASKGLTAIPPTIADAKPAGTDPTPEQWVANCELSVRERHVLGRIARGDPNKVIAKSLDISESTVKAHLKSILRKIGVRNRTQAAIWAFNNGLAIDNLSCDAKPAGE
jgi:two-component system nitrate/nitrite response regulator NarL